MNPTKTMTGRTATFNRRTIAGFALMVLAYSILLATLFAKSAVALVVLLPLGVLCFVAGFILWVRAVAREAREKGLL